VKTDKVLTRFAFCFVLQIGARVAVYEDIPEISPLLNVYVHKLSSYIVKRLPVSIGPFFSVRVYQTELFEHRDRMEDW
jgi:hypothetical protein